MATEIYQQCILHKGGTMMVSWLPTKFAHKNRIVELKINGEWDNGWKVVTQFGTKITREELDMLEGQHEWTREASDI